MIQATLVFFPGTVRERTVVLDKPLHQVGRGAEAGVVVDSPNVSSLHASFVCKNGSITVTDLGSTNGTRVNGKRIESITLKDGDRIKFADVECLFRTRQLDRAPVPAGFQTTMLQQNLDRFDDLYSLLETAVPMTDRDALIRTILMSLKKMLALDVCGYYSVDESVFHVLEDQEVVAEAATETISESVLDTVLSSGEPVFLENIGSDSAVVGFKSLTQFNIQSLLCVPVKKRSGEISGALYCVSRRSGQLGMVQQDQLFLRACSFLISLAFDHFAMVVREKEMAHAEEQERLLPVITRLRQERENLALKLRPQAESPPLAWESLFSPDFAEGIRKAAHAGIPMLLTGETGVGKSMLARDIHAMSRASRPFVVIDCTTIPAELLESELFGHEKGAFTGAVARSQGRVEAAGNGTLFIDEISELSPKLQGKLLRLVQNGEYEPVGSAKPRASAARIIAATNKDLRAEVASGRFREDLYFRLHVFSIVIPPLRERKAQVPLLAGHFLSSNRERMGSSATGFTPEALARLLEHSWPGNIRELENSVMRGLVNASGTRIDAPDLQLETERASQPADGMAVPIGPLENGLDLKQARERIDAQYIRRALLETGDNVSQAAKLLHISRNALMELKKKYGL